jgi:hypothetical protein
MALVAAGLSIVLAATASRRTAASVVVAEAK